MDETEKAAMIVSGDLPQDAKDIIEFWVRYSNFGVGVIALNVAERIAFRMRDICPLVRTQARKLCQEYARTVEESLPPPLPKMTRKKGKGQRSFGLATGAKNRNWKCQRCNKVLTVRCCLECDIHERKVVSMPADPNWFTGGPEPTRKCVPTHHKPGTREKMDVLSLRLLNGQELYHEDDAKLEPGDATGSARGKYGC